MLSKSAHTLLKPTDWAQTLASASLQFDGSVGEVAWAAAGNAAGMATLESFIDVRLKYFATHRNDPNSDALSQLSPWLRFGK